MACSPLRPDFSKVQTLSFTGTAAQSSKFAAGGTSDITLQLAATQACYLLIGPNPTATSANGMLLPAATVIRVVAAPEDKISAIQASTAGALSLIVLDH